MIDNETKAKAWTILEVEIRKANKNLFGNKELISEVQLIMGYAIKEASKPSKPNMIKTLENACRVINHLKIGMEKGIEKRIKKVEGFCLSCGHRGYVHKFNLDNSWKKKPNCIICKDECEGFKLK